MSAVDRLCCKRILNISARILIQGQAGTRNNDSKEPALRFDSYKFLFHRARLATFATQSAINGPRIVLRRRTNRRCAGRMLSGRRPEVPHEPGIRGEDFFQYLAMDAVIAPRPLADREKSHVVEAIVGDCDAHMRHALGVTARLERQTVRAAYEISGTARRHEALATKPGKDRPGSSQVGHGCAPTQIDPPP